jgi:hypothetical protein
MADTTDLDYLWRLSRQSCGIPVVVREYSPDQRDGEVSAARHHERQGAAENMLRMDTGMGDADCLVSLPWFFPVIRHFHHVVSFPRHAQYCPTIALPILSSEVTENITADTRMPLL